MTKWSVELLIKVLLPTQDCGEGTTVTTNPHQSPEHILSAAKRLAYRNGTAFLQITEKEWNLSFVTTHGALSSGGKTRIVFKQRVRYMETLLAQHY